MFALGALAIALGAFGAPARIVVAWTTASEIETVGFNVYRSDAVAGAYTKLNAELIYGARDPLRGDAYRYADDTITPGKTYYYKLEEIERSGAATQHGPVVAVAPPRDLALWLGVGATLLLGGFAVRQRCNR